jgi:hypothetical protein
VPGPAATAVDGRRPIGERPAMTANARLIGAGALVLLAAVVLLGSLARAIAPASPGATMAAAANDLLAAFTPEQKKQATFALEDAHRTTWFYVPLARKGIPFKQMTPAQRTAALRLLRAGLSQPGFDKATNIMELDKVLAILEKNPVRRDPELYYFSVFGTPAAAGTWGFRVEGHHVSINITVVKGNLIATTPEFLGANPAEVRLDGPFKGRRVLHAEEDLARELVKSLDPKQRAQAVVSETAPGDILTTNRPKADPPPIAGITAQALTPKQIETLRKVLAEYAARLPDALASERLARIEKAGFEKIRFAWAGTLERGGPHYYRVQGPTFVIEYDNTQNDANHVHTVFRDFEDDFGRDLLREHYQSAHR